MFQWTAAASLGAPGDTIVSGCHFTENKGASIAIFRSKNRLLRYKNVADSNAHTVRLGGLGSCDLIGCGDTDGDGDDELLFTVRGPDNHVRLVGYKTTGRRIFKRRFNRLARSLVVERPESPIPLVTVIEEAGAHGRQIKVTTMAGSLAFPLF